MKRAVFFDRDDTLIRNIPYNGDPAKVELLPGAREALLRLSEAGWVLCIVSNQSGVGRGLITPEQVDAVNREMLRQLDGPVFAGIYNCYAAPGQPDDGCRKPAPGLLQLAAREQGIDLQRSVMVGDRLSDIEAGRAAGCRTVLVLGGDHASEQEWAAGRADAVARSLMEVADWILEQEASHG
jgi:D-glycero-D-manno-heptose 1,7-bisphosphate phosphatase